MSQSSIKSKNLKKQPIEETKVAPSASTATNILPDEWLLSVIQGGPVKTTKLIQNENNNEATVETTTIEEDYYPTFQERYNAALALIPYFRAKLVPASDIQAQVKLTFEECSLKAQTAKKKLTKKRKERAVSSQ